MSDRDKVLEEAAREMDDFCAHCEGKGYTVGPVCCNRPLPSGECCSNPDAERIQCPDQVHQLAGHIRALKGGDSIAPEQPTREDVERDADDIDMPTSGSMERRE